MGNREEWRQSCLASLNSAILSAHGHSSHTVLFQKGEKNTVPTSMQLAATTLVQDYATAFSTIPLPSDYNLSNTHPVPQPSGEQCPKVRI